MTNRIELRIADRVAFADGHAFGDVGAYERLSGRAHFAVDPRAAAQADVVDLDKAPRDDARAGALRRRLHDPEAGRSGARQPAGVLRLRQSRPQARAAVLQRRAAQQRSADHAGACRQRLLHAARLRGGVARLGGRHAAGRRPHGAGRAGGAPTTARRSPGRCASSTSSTRRARTSFPLSGRIAAHSYRHGVARHARCGADAAALSVRSAARSSRPTNGASPASKAARGGETADARARCRPVATGTSTCRRASSRAGSMNSSIRRRIRWCMASATSRCATSSAS